VSSSGLSLRTKIVPQVTHARRRILEDAMARKVLFDETLDQELCYLFCSLDAVCLSELVELACELQATPTAPPREAKPMELGCQSVTMPRKRPSAKTLDIPSRYEEMSYA
jgi:hypothetical protein